VFRGSSHVSIKATNTVNFLPDVPVRHETVGRNTKGVRVPFVILPGKMRRDAVNFVRKKAVQKQLNGHGADPDGVRVSFSIAM